MIPTEATHVTPRAHSTEATKSSTPTSIALRSVVSVVECSSRSWRKLHIGVDADSGEIAAVAVTRKDIDDAAMADALLDQSVDPIASFTANGVYDQDQVSQAVEERHPDAAVIVPPRVGAVASSSAGTAATQRDRHLRMITERGRMAWQKASGYNLRAKVEATIGRYKRVIGDALRTDQTEATEVAIAAAALTGCWRSEARTMSVSLE